MIQADVSFNLSDKKEIIKYENTQIETDICSTFVNLLSIDINTIKENIVDKIDYSDISSIKVAYKEIYKIEPLLLLDEFNIIDQIDTHNNVSQKLVNIEESISQVMTLLKSEESLNPESRTSLRNTLKFLRKKKSIYRKLTTNIKQIVNNTFESIISILELYREIIDICFIDETDEYFDGFSKLSPLKKYVFYKMFVIKDNYFFEDLPSCNINFTFDCSSEEFSERMRKNWNKKNHFNLLFDTELSPMYEYHCQSFKQYMQVSFYTSLIQNLNIKKCNNCKKYFIAYQRSDEKYCNRISPQDSSKTCKQYSNFINWKNNINSNEALKTYRRIYMAKQMQTRRNPEDIELRNKFQQWKIEAQKKRNDYSHGHISTDYFINWLNKD